jgi:hypothetical protein
MGANGIGRYGTIPATPPPQQDGWIAGTTGPGAEGGPIGAIEHIPVVGGLIKSMDPANPFKGLQQALGNASQQAQYNANLQWQRQMEGLQRALGYSNHAQASFDKVYGQRSAAPGSTVPQGLGAQIPQGGQQSQGAGLAAFLGRGR